MDQGDGSIDPLSGNQEHSGSARSVSAKNRPLDLSAGGADLDAGVRTEVAGGDAGVEGEEVVGGVGGVLSGVHPHVVAEPGAAASSVAILAADGRYVLLGGILAGPCDDLAASDGDHGALGVLAAADACGGLGKFAGLHNCCCCFDCLLFAC